MSIHFASLLSFLFATRSRSWSFSSTFAPAYADARMLINTPLVIKNAQIIMFLAF